MKSNQYHKVIGCLLIMALFSSCATQNLFEGQLRSSKKTDVNLFSASIADYKIRTGDKLTMSIWAHDDLSIGSLFGVYNSNEVYGKWVFVDAAGTVMLPKLGQTHLSGMNLKEAGDFLSEKYATFLVDPIIIVKVLNKEVSVLGDVITQGRFPLEKDYISLVDILAMAGGFDTYANKKAIKIIRGGKENPKEYVVDLTSMPDYKLSNIAILPDDIVYVPSRKGKMFDRRSTSILPLTSVLSTIAIIISVAK